MTPEEIEGFLEYLKGTLIPDLVESGHLATAADFETCSEIIRALMDTITAL